MPPRTPQDWQKSHHAQQDELEDEHCKKIIECRTCANASLQARREARKRNAKLLKGEE